MSTPPTLEYGRPEPKRHWRASSLLKVLGVLLALYVLQAVMFPTIGRSREKANQIKCASNLRQIGQAIQLYAQGNRGVFPTDPQAIAATRNISLDCFVCPSSADTRAAKPDELPAHHSYICVGADLSSRSRPECIVVLEDPANHGLQGGNVLFADGHVEFLDLPTIQRILNELNAGRNPPATLTPNLSQAAAEQDYQKNWKPRMPQLKTGVWHIPTTQPAKPE